jgi:UDP-2-acetamido-3-amino-2,3-dideoxy-glucuronate N-acetyltransferase
VTAYIHPTALVNPGFTPSPFTIIDEGVAIFEDVKMGSFVHVRAGARLRKGCVIGDHVTVCENVDLGERCTVQDFALVGRFPDFVEEGQPAPEGTTIGEGTVIGSHTVVHAGAVLGKECVVGDNAVVTGSCVLPDESEVAMGVVFLGGE